MSNLDQLTALLQDKPSVDLAVKLRGATADAHAAIERLPIMLRLTSREVTQDDYRRYLHVISGIYIVVETALFKGLDDALREHLGVRPKLPMLLRDLEEQAGQAPAMIAERDPRYFETRGTSAIVGGLYVLEGATLGGRTIARHLRRILGAKLGSASFLDFHGEQTSTHWKRFSTALETFSTDGTLLPDEVIAGALVTFDTIYRWLEQADSTHRNI
ncbi:biliverdin-producing heme oxygenase [Thiocystis minor]|uniref:biliverdin-producing heme oxygenase n=1 Tax=Thiocystis minor TaxID=61597 RepID=UPI001913C203|nr:biliverdin-producing heme oxygenase [Thiocystis minor]MBK5965480.1 biliverdin-producing heme oxygenase [Thiocystis minor]